MTDYTPCPALLRFVDELGVLIETLECAAGDVTVGGRGLKNHNGPHQFRVDREDDELRYLPTIREEGP